MTLRLLPCLLLALGVPVAAPAAQPAAFTGDQLSAALARDLSAHFQLDGDLELEMLRPWAAPEATSANWTVSVTEYPPAPSSTMSVRCRVLADGAQVDEATLVFRAALWRDAWYARQPLSAGGMFDPSVLETRRVDWFRERNALPASAGDSSFIFSPAIMCARRGSWRQAASLAPGVTPATCPLALFLKAPRAR